MSFLAEIAALEALIAETRDQRDRWQASGLQEHYRAACLRVKALEYELKQLRSEGLLAFAKRGP